MIVAMPSFPQTEAFILVGGKSSRMGRDKALLELAGAPLLTRTAELVGLLVNRVTLVGDPQLYGGFGFNTLSDRWPGAGPLGAIATALVAAREPWCLVLACDLPYLTSAWLAWQLGHANKSSADILIPETAHGLEPLCAVYRSSCAPVLAAALDRGIRKVTCAFVELTVERIQENKWREFSPEGTLFRNMNNWEDYLEVQKQFTK